MASPASSSGYASGSHPRCHHSRFWRPGFIVGLVFIGLFNLMCLIFGVIMFVMCVIGYLLTFILSWSPCNCQDTPDILYRIWELGSSTESRRWRHECFPTGLEFGVEIFGIWAGRSWEFEVLSFGRFEAFGFVCLGWRVRRTQNSLCPMPSCFALKGGSSWLTSFLHRPYHHSGFLLRD